MFHVVAIEGDRATVTVSAGGTGVVAGRGHSRQSSRTRMPSHPQAARIVITMASRAMPAMSWAGISGGFRSDRRPDVGSQALRSHLAAGVLLDQTSERWARLAMTESDMAQVDGLGSASGSKRFGPGAVADVVMEAGVHGRRI